MVDFQIDRVIKICFFKVGTWSGNSGPEISLTWRIHVLPIMRCIVCNLELCSRRWVYIAQIFFVFCSLIRKDWTHFILLLPKCNLPYMHCLYGKNPCNIHPLLISTGFLKYPVSLDNFSISKISVWEYENSISVLTWFL